MATNKAKRPIPAAQHSERRRLNPRSKYHAYQVLDDLNRGFQITHTSLERLYRLDIVPPDHLRPCRNMAEELRALTNSALLATLRDAEFHDAARFEKLRLAWERRSGDRIQRRSK
ncbi:MAG TPA: hypothetical protein VKY85_08630 [Candidatus Angelobacter sp.]|nr:hypothetical protein [Candidatus Angelobacter sp.]